MGHALFAELRRPCPHLRVFLISKPSVFSFLKTDKRFFVHTSFFAAFSTVYTSAPNARYAREIDVIVFVDIHLLFFIVLVWTEGVNTEQKYAFSNENALVWTEPETM